MTTEESDKVNLDEVRESNEQFIAAWSLYARNSGEGEVVEINNLCIANARLPWYLMNAAMLSSPVSSEEDLADRATAAIKYFAAEKWPWFLFGGREWMGEGAPEILSRLGFTEAFKLVGMVCDKLQPPTRTLPEVETRCIDNETLRLVLADLNADAYNISSDWVRSAVAGASLWQTPMYGYNAYVDGKPAATGFAVPLNGVIYVGYVATAEAHRRKGLAELVMRRSVEHATKDTGITRTALHATADGYPVYLKMGYRPAEWFSVFVPK